MRPHNVRANGAMPEVDNALRTEGLDAMTAGTLLPPSHEAAPKPKISEPYQQQLLEAGARPDDVEEMANNWQYAPLEHQKGEQTIPYVVLGKHHEYPAQKVFYINGFVEGIEAKASFGTTLANAGYEVILPGWNRKGVATNLETGQPDATLSQALNYLAIIKHQGLQDESIDFFAHSHGAQVVDVMHQLATAWGWKCFDGSHVVLSAPAGMNPDETRPALLARTLRSAGEEDKNTRDGVYDFPDQTKSGLWAAARYLRSNPLRAYFEFREIADPNRLVDLERMAASGIAKIIVLANGKDSLFPYETRDAYVLRAVMDETVNRDGKLSYVYLNSLQPMGNGIRGRRGSSHNADSLNPKDIVDLLSLEAPYSKDNPYGYVKTQGLLRDPIKI